MSLSCASVSLWLKQPCAVQAPASDDGVARDDFAVEVCAEFGHTLLRLVVNVAEAEAVGVTVGPLEVVHQAPEEVAADGDALGRRAAQLREVAAQVRDAVGVVDLAVRRGLVRRGAAVLGDVNLRPTPELLDMAR